MRLTNSGKEAQSSKIDERLLPVSTRRRIRTVSEVGLLIDRSGVWKRHGRFASPHSSGIRRIRLLNTVAGPFRIRTGFPVTPTRAPQKLFPNLPDSLLTCVSLLFGELDACAAQLPTVTAPAQIGDRKRGDFYPPERRFRSIQSKDDRRSNECGMSNGNGMAGVGTLP